MFSLDPFCLVICGGAGDLSRRKLLPTLFHLYREKILPENFSVIGFGVPDMSSEEYRALTKDALQEFSESPLDSAEAGEFLRRLDYRGGDFEQDDSYQNLKRDVLEKSYPGPNGERNVIYYMAVPPTFFPVLIRKLDEHGLNRGEISPRIVIEKPFGRDLQSAVELNEIVSQAFLENQIYRMDHYLGKETVQNILYFRFSNSIFEPLWNRRYIDNVQITAAETIGIEHRGKFYEQAGIGRDIIQNHMMQLVGLIAMEPPSGFEADLIRDEKIKALRALRPLSRADARLNVVFGQYGADPEAGARAYREEKHVAPDSVTPTFFAGRFYIDNWRWAGVPFYVRAGKRMPRKLTEIVIQFRMPPLSLFGDAQGALEPGYLILTIQPQESIILRYHVKYPNSARRTQAVNMEFCYDREFEEKSYPAYSRLLMDCMKGDLTLFVRQDGIETMWKFIDPVLKCREEEPYTDFPNYAAGTWGPQEADDLLTADGRTWFTR